MVCVLFSVEVYGPKLREKLRNEEEKSSQKCNVACSAPAARLPVIMSDPDPDDPPLANFDLDFDPNMLPPASDDEETAEETQENATNESASVVEVSSDSDDDDNSIYIRSDPDSDDDESNAHDDNRHVNANVATNLDRATNEGATNADEGAHDGSANEIAQDNASTSSSGVPEDTKSLI